MVSICCGVNLAACNRRTCLRTVTQNWERPYLTSSCGITGGSWSLAAACSLAQFRLAVIDVSCKAAERNAEPTSQRTWCRAPFSEGISSSFKDTNVPRPRTNYSTLESGATNSPVEMRPPEPAAASVIAWSSDWSSGPLPPTNRQNVCDRLDSSATCWDTKVVIP